MVDDAFTRAADKEERLQGRARGHAVRRMGLTIVGGIAIGEVVAVVVLGIPLSDAVFRRETLLSQVVVLGPFLLLSARGWWAMSPLWHVPGRERRRVTSAVLSGRAVDDPELAGLAVATASFARRTWWWAIPGFVATAVLVGLAWTPLRTTTAGNVVVVMRAASLVLVLVYVIFFVWIRNAPHAETANRRLVEDGRTGEDPLRHGPMP